MKKKKYNIKNKISQLKLLRDKQLKKERFSSDKLNPQKQILLNKVNSFLFLKLQLSKLVIIN